MCATENGHVWDASAGVEPVTQEKIDVYASLSGDFNPLHVDEEVAARSSFKGTIAHGPIGLHSFFRSLTAYFAPGPLPADLLIDISYRRPVRPGDTIECVLRDESEKDARVELETACVNQRGEEVTLVKASFLR